MYRKPFLLSILILIMLISMPACGGDGTALPEGGAEQEGESQKGPALDIPAVPVDFTILPDSELVYGPTADDFSISDAVGEDSQLFRYSEEVDEEQLSGTEILEKVSRDYSVSPRLLLALLEYRSGWVRGQGAGEYPVASDYPELKGLFRQLSWAANEINRGFYTRRVGGLKAVTFADGTAVDIPAGLNDASAALQYVFGLMMDYPEWQVAVGPLGLHAAYVSIFGDPQAYAVEPLIPAGLSQPDLRLPFEAGEGWFFTSGPHSAWGNGAAWAALDFAPDDEQFACYDSDAWVLAAADGLVVRSKDGAVVQDLDGDGQEGTGWTILYMHIAERDRVQEGAYLQAGDRIGHPSCEGGPATGTHLHIARRYNGEWIPADQDIPFNLGGWMSSGDGLEYDGTLKKGERSVSASGYPDEENKILP